MPFNLTDHPLAFQFPPMANPISAWLSHTPLTPVFMGLLRPERFVELGTHGGDSYLAFCQAVQGLGLATQCTAIDTWKGDPHAGFYGPEILENLERRHERFSAFSKLMQATFDEALPAFADGSIDLLHIDGRHDYVSVKHDYETWLPKVSTRGVVVFHDTTERMGDFGVYKLWDEISPQFPHFNVPHGHGLGILAVGKDVAPAFLEFLEALNAQPPLVKSLEYLGGHVQLYSQYQIAVVAMHDCQSAVNHWRQRTGQPIVNPITNMQAISDRFSQFAHVTRQEVEKMLGDALNVAAEVTRLRGQNMPPKT